MDHKDFLNDVIKEMSSKTNDTKPLEQEDSVEGMIKLKISTGETYLIDPKTFDWNASIRELSQLESNADQMRQMAFSVLNNASDEDLDFMIGQLLKYLEGYQIDPQYERFDASMTKEKKLMLLLFDTSNIISEMIKNISLFSAISMFTGTGLSGKQLSGLVDENEDFIKDIKPDSVPRFIGYSDDPIENGLDMNPIFVNGEETLCYNGDTVYYKDKLFTLVDDRWMAVNVVIEDEDESEDENESEEASEIVTDLDEPISSINQIFLDDDREHSGLIDE